MGEADATEDSERKEIRAALGAREPGDPPPLTDEYHRARRNLNFASALLFGWELVGLQLGKLVKTPEIVWGEPMVEIDLFGVPIIVKSPDAAPGVLIALVLFFAFRLRMEWGQCSTARRRQSEAQWDIAASYTLAVIAVALYLTQLAIDAQVWQHRGAFLLWVVGAQVGFMVLDVVPRPGHRVTQALVFRSAPAISVGAGFLVLVVMDRVGDMPWQWGIVGLCCGVAFDVWLRWKGAQPLRQ